MRNSNSMTHICILNGYHIAQAHFQAHLQPQPFSVCKLSHSFDYESDEDKKKSTSLIAIDRA